ncbi:MAG: serine hydrolase domain-containing protein [Pyrinomonadaceae bacterium]
MSKAKCAAFLALLFALVPTLARADAADEIIRSWMAERQIPGVALIVLKNGKVLKGENYGYSDLARKTPVTDATVFEIASMTKQFTAAAVLLLVEYGKLGLDDPVSKYLPDVPPTWRNISVRQLLDHTSGLYDDWNENNEYFQSRNSDQEFFDALKSSKLKFAPGERYAYSCGPFLAGMIVSKVAGVPYAEFMRKRIFEPLRMSSTFVNGHGPAKIDAAVGYIMRDGKIQEGVKLSPPAHGRGDVGISTTASDLTIWLSALSSTRLLTKKSLNEMFKFAKLNDGSTVPSGLGWWLNPIRGEPIRHHGGAFRTGFNSTINWYPKSGIAVIILANRFRSAANDIGHMVAGVYDPAYIPVSRRKPTDDREPDRAKRLYDMLSVLSRGGEDVPSASKRFPYRYYEKEDLKDLLEGSERMYFRGCDDISRRHNKVFGEKVKEVCFFELNGKDRRPVSFLLDARGKVLYVEPFEY